MRTGHLSGVLRFMYARVTLDFTFLCCRPPLLVFETSSLYSRYLRPFLSFITEIWLYFPTRRLRCSSPALSAKFKPSKNNNVSSSFCGVSVPRILCFYIYSSCSSEMTSALFLSIPRPRPDNSFIFESSTFLNP